MKTILTHDSGATKKIKIGFSWTTFFFGLFVPLIRGDLKWAAIMFVLEALIGGLTFGIGVGVVTLVFSFIYNKIYIRDLVEKGYKAVSESDNAIIRGYINR